jgi:hypothetical protein
MPRIFRLQEHLQSWQEELVREDVILKGIPDPTVGLLWKEEEALRPITCSLHEEDKEVEQEVLEVQESIQTVTEAEGRFFACPVASAVQILIMHCHFSFQ